MTCAPAVAITPPPMRRSFHISDIIRLLPLLASLALAATTLTHVALAQQLPPVSLAGTVADEHGDVVAGASISLLNLNSGRASLTQTDAGGRYEFAGLPPGHYRISISVAGFETIAESISLQRGAATLTQNFTLAPGRLRDSITVTATKGNARFDADTPQSVSVADARAIELRRPASPLRALELTPNLTPIGASAAIERPRLRGLSSNRLLLLVDGERLNNARSDPLSGISPSVVDPAELQSVEVISGAGSSLYGSDALAGTINLVTKTPERTTDGQRIALRFDGDARRNGQFRRGATTLNLSDPHLALRLNGSLFRAGNYHTGGAGVSLAEVVRAGQFLNDLGNATGNNIARTYAVWDLPPGAEIVNGQGRGFNFEAGLWAFLPRRQTLRYRQLNSQHKDLGFPFSAPPFDARRQSNAFRRLDKYGLRYEGLELKTWLPRLAFNFYRQKYAFTDANFVSTINAGSSWRLAAAPGSLPALTGTPSTFTPGIFTDGKNSVTSYGLDAQGTLAAPFGLLITTGVNYLSDASRDEFARVDYSPGASGTRGVSGRAANPDARYRNLGWFSLLEYEPRRWLRLTGGLRLDNWTTGARHTPGFPLDKEAAALSASFPRLVAAPGAINVAGVGGIVALINGSRQQIGTRRTVATGNIGLVVRAPGGVNPYFRWGNSYREPGITERYILRDFGDPTFSVLLVSNTELRPERGGNYDAGVKIRRERWQVSINYFRNTLTDFLRPAFSDALFVPADAARGLLPLSPFFPFHGVLYAQRTNTARARIEGYEATGETSIALGRFGHLTPSVNAGGLRGSDLTPDADALRLIRDFYNRDGATPVPLHGAADDVPLAGMTPFRGVFRLRYDSPRARWFGEYQARHQSRITRADPLELSAAISTQYGTLASLNSFTTQAARIGYDLRRERQRMLLTLGIENLTNRFYFEQFQTAPASGRSVVFGVTLELFNLRR